MKIVAFTQNDKKAAEYREQFGLYGIKTGLSICAEASDLDRIILEDETIDLAFRETSDIFDAQDGSRISRPYRVPENYARPVYNVSKATVWRRAQDGSVTRKEVDRAMRGVLLFEPLTKEGVFDWDDAFVPHGHAGSYHQAKAGPGKVSARSLVLDESV